MKLFTALYDKTLSYSAHPKAAWYLGGLSFAESSFFPIPPDVMLAPMCLAKRNRAWFYAFITTVLSVIGGLFGYLIGWLAFDLVEPILHDFGYTDKFQLAISWFNEWGVWVVFLAGFTPIPYKVFTIAAGVTGMALLPFVIASLVGRGARFFIVAALMFIGGEKMQTTLRKYIEILGWFVIVLAITLYIILK